MANIKFILSRISHFLMTPIVQNLHIWIVIYLMATIFDVYYFCGRVVKRVLDKVEDGDIILLHDMSDSSVKAALEIIDRMQEQGYTFVTVSELAERRGTALEGGKVYYCF